MQQRKVSGEQVAAPDAQRLTDTYLYNWNFILCNIHAKEKQEGSRRNPEKRNCKRAPSGIELLAGRNSTRARSAVGRLVLGTDVKKYDLLNINRNWFTVHTLKGYVFTIM